MDVPISPAVRKRRQTRRWFIGLAVGLVLALVTLGLSRLQPAAPLVENAFTDTVKRGELLRQVRGNGSLVPEEIRWIPTINAGRVESILVLPGARVKVDTVLVELANPEAEQAGFDAASQVKAAEADMANLRVQLDSQKLTQQAAVASAQANSSAANLDLEVNEDLARSGLVPALILKQSKAKADELAKLFEIEQERLKMCGEAAKAQLAAQEAKVAQLRGQRDLKQRQVDGLKIRAGMDGVLQRLGDLTNPLQVGQQMAAGAIIARVANPAKLKAAIKIAETQAKDIQIDQLAEIDTRNGVIPGHVLRVDPAVENGTVTVDVGLDAPLPKGARPDLSVDGTIQLERLNDVMYVGRPVQAPPDSTVGLFKVVEGGKAAIRVSVKLGRGSVSAIEIAQGLQVGDQVILSDMSQWDRFERVRLK
ncbi:MAG: HlyD family efflux transporter periplasmic adaptor subunit [Verrucomicrobia bacterium]|nr:HlyD family efflux transporter periplasmic adaptor subunit [Verrucomicrobiota bacterium]